MDIEIGKTLYHTEKYYPDTMKRLPCWVLWKLEERNGKKTKVPYSAHDYTRRASTTDEKTWSSYDDAVMMLSKHPDEFNGLGFVIAEQYGLVFVDFDHVIQPAADGIAVLDESKVKYFEYLKNSYCEVSQSGTGLHFLVSGKIPRSFNNRTAGVEMYQNARFVALTGDALRVTDITPAQDGLTAVYNEFKTPDPTPRRAPEGHVTPVSMDDANLIAHMEWHGKFGALYLKGEWQTAGYASHSEGDAALCAELAFWCDRDFTTIDRIFRTSAMYRKKWERDDYRTATIARACDFIKESITEWKARQDEQIAEFWDI